MTATKKTKDTQSLPLLPLRDGVLLPGTVATIPVGRPQSVALVNATAIGGIVAVGVQKDAAVTDPPSTTSTTSPSSPASPRCSACPAATR